MKLIVKIGYTSFMMDVPKEDTGSFFNIIRNAKSVNGYPEVVDDTALDVSLSIYTPPVENNADQD